MSSLVIIILCILILYFLFKSNGFEGFRNTKKKLTFVEEMELIKLLRIMRENFEENKMV